MLKKFISTTAFFAAWVFVLSLLSNCYCAPMVLAPQKQMASHCDHHSAKTNKSDCSPRYNTDHFENNVSRNQPVQSLPVDLPLQVIVDQKTSLPAFQFKDKPFFDSSPPIYILVRSLLI